jgi:hypothetical protein
MEQVRQEPATEQAMGALSLRLFSTSVQHNKMLASSSQTCLLLSCRRPFMQEELLNLPNKPVGRDLVRRGWQPSDIAWLNTTFINYCTYGQQYPYKPTVIFTDLPQGALPGPAALQRVSGAAKGRTMRTQ